MKIVIVGAGAVGTHLSKLLSREHQDCVLIDDNEERLEGVAEYDVMTYNALPTSISALKDAGTANADLLPTDLVLKRRLPASTTTNTSQHRTSASSNSLESTQWSIRKYWLPPTL